MCKSTNIRIYIKVPGAYDGHEEKGISRNVIFEKEHFCYAVRFKNVSFFKGYFEADGRPATRSKKWERAEN